MKRYNRDDRAGMMMEDEAGDWVKYDDVRDMLDTLKAAIENITLELIEREPVADVRKIMLDVYNKRI